MQEAVSRTCCRTRRMELKSIIFPFLDSSPPSRRTDEVARWRWSPLLWRFCRWELSHRRLLLSASPRMVNTTWAQQRRPRPKRHPCKGDREIRPSHRNRSRSLVRFKPFVQYSYPHRSLELQLRRSPCARESSCLQGRLPPWQDVAAERPALGLLHADQNLSLHHPRICPTISAVLRNDSSSVLFIV